MISIVICSVRPADLSQAKSSIEATIGVPHEIIAIDNAASRRGICAVYNEGTRAARYDIICYMHEDIEMLTPDWGQKIVAIFNENAGLGIVGIAGGGYKSLCPSSWYNYHLQENGGFYCNLIQGYRHSGAPDKADLRNARNEKLSRVACVDGCWFCARKEAAVRYPFDEHLLRRFHGYDLDFAIAAGQAYEVAVTFEILLRHFSEGNFDHTWLEEIVKVHEKWSHILPVNADNLPEKSLKSLERHVLLLFLQDCINKENFTKLQLLRLVWSTRRSRVATLSFPFKLMIALLKMKKSA